jgi:hypothetical protein
VSLQQYFRFDQRLCSCPSVSVTDILSGTE